MGISKEDRDEGKGDNKGIGASTDFRAVIALTSLFIITCLPKANLC